MLGRFGLPAFSGADGVDRIASPRDDDRTLRAWNWALDDDLAWPTLTAVRVGEVWDVFEWGALSGGPTPEDSLAQATARERPAVPRERRLSDATKARFASLGIPTTAIAVRGARVTPPAREPFLADVLRVRRALSYGNTIALREEAAAVTQKVRTMPTDPARVRRTDPGDPTKCPVWPFHEVYSGDDVKAWVQQCCRSAGIGCLDCNAWARPS